VPQATHQQQPEREHPHPDRITDQLETIVYTSPSLTISFLLLFLFGEEDEKNHGIGSIFFSYFMLPFLSCLPVPQGSQQQQPEREHPHPDRHNDQLDYLVCASPSSALPFFFFSWGRKRGMTAL
jgi:hypothetical protein